jgi:hypothetical protein
MVKNVKRILKDPPLVVGGLACLSGGNLHQMVRSNFLDL